mgnify:CR=1 FL=1
MLNESPAFRGGHAGMFEMENARTATGLEQDGRQLDVETFGVDGDQLGFRWVEAGKKFLHGDHRDRSGKDVRGG